MLCAMRSMAEALVLDPAGLAFRDRGHGISTVHLATAARGATAILNGITRISPGAAVPEHFHNCEESVIVLAGRAIGHLDGANYNLPQHCATLIPAGVPHYLANPSADEPVLIFWTYASIEATRTIVATGKTSRIADELGVVD